MLSTQGNLFPFRQHSEYEVIKLYSLDGTGMNGQLVAFETGNSAPINSDGTYIQTAPGATFTNATSFRYVNQRFVRLTNSGDLNINTAGVLLYNTQEYDIHGNKLILQPPSRWDELGCVPSGFTNPILMRGIIDIGSNMVVDGTPFPGYAALIATGTQGAFAARDPATLVSGIYVTGNQYSYCPAKVVGRFLSSTGSVFSSAYPVGHVQLHLEL